ncbi:MAG: tryptophan synthase subunit alpha, partial [Bifidobacterium breve]|nr:tryptophan synthase subunit alpha [Bifidobacterium breve]
MWPAPTATPSPDKKRRLLIMTNEATTPSGQPLGISHKPSKSGAMFTKFKA